MLTIQPKNLDSQLDAEVGRFEKISSPSVADVAPVADAIRAAFEENFDSESSAFGRWQGLSRSTQRDRERSGYPPTHSILVRRGTYKKSFTDAGSNDHVQELDVDIAAWSLFVGSRHDFARWHELGTGRMPARPALPLNDVQESRIAERVIDFLRSA